jgi:hypothetical protein
MRKLLGLIAGAMLLVGPVVFTVTQTGCTMTQNRITYQTLYGIGKATDNAYMAYNDMVVAGKIAPASLEKVGKAWTTYRLAYNAAVSVAQLNLNAPAPTNVIEASNAVFATINTVK